MQQKSKVNQHTYLFMYAPFRYRLLGTGQLNALDLVPDTLENQNCKVTSSTGKHHHHHPPTGEFMYVGVSLGSMYIFPAKEMSLPTPTHIRLLASHMYTTHTHTHTHIRTLTNQIALLVCVVTVYRIRCIQVVVPGMGGNHNHVGTCM